MSEASLNISKYLEDKEKENEPFSFIKIEYLVDIRAAEVKYKEEYKNNVGGIKDCRMSFTQWIEIKKFDALNFEVKYSDYYLGF